MRTVVSTKAAPNPVGPYSQAVKANGFIFASGQIPLDPATLQIVPGGIVEQTVRTLRNVSGLLEAAGSDMSKIVRCVVYLKTMGDFAAMNKTYAKFFGENPPPRTTAEAAHLPKDALIEIEVTAIE